MNAIQIQINKGHTLVFDRGLSDAIRLLSIIMISLHHYFQGLLVNGYGNLFHRAYCTQAGYLGVALFFFFSGYGLAKSNGKHYMGAWEYFQKRILKVLMPMIWASLLWAIFLKVGVCGLGLIELENVCDVTEGGVFLALLSLSGDGGMYFDSVMWFMKVLLMMYISFWFYATVKKSFQYNRTVLPLLTITVFTLIVVLVVCKFMRPWMAISVPLFLFGVSVADYPKCVSKYFWVIVVGIIAICVTVTLITRSEFIVHIAFNYVFVMVMLMTVYLLNIRVRLPAGIGSWQFDVYLTHNKARMLLFGMCSQPSLLSFLLTTSLFTVIQHYSKKLLPNFGAKQK